MQEPFPITQTAVLRFGVPFGYLWVLCGYFLQRRASRPAYGVYQLRPKSAVRKPFAYARCYPQYRPENQTHRRTRSPTPYPATTDNGLYCHSCRFSAKTFQRRKPIGNLLYQQSIYVGGKSYSERFSDHNRYFQLDW